MNKIHNWNKEDERDNRTSADSLSSHCLVALSITAGIQMTQWKNSFKIDFTSFSEAFLYLVLFLKFKSNVC